MSKQRNGQPLSRRRHSAEFKVEALGLVERVGVASAAGQLGLHESQLYDWRKKARYEAGRSELEKMILPTHSGQDQGVSVLCWKRWHSIGGK